VGQSLSFKYDPFGRRIYKSSSAVTSVYAYDGDNLVEETNASGAVVSRYSLGLNIDEPLAMSRSSLTSFYNSDGLGSVTSLANAAGSLAQPTHSIRSENRPPRPVRLRTRFNTPGANLTPRPASITIAPDTTTRRLVDSLVGIPRVLTAASTSIGMSRMTQSIRLTLLDCNQRKGREERNQTPLRVMRCFQRTRRQPVWRS
jgi:hypothetical protein